jgi:hypothetical protein
MKYMFSIQFPKCREQTYIFGYDFISGTDFGRACRDIVNGGWVVDIIGPAHTDRAKRGPFQAAFLFTPQTGAADRGQHRQAAKLSSRC